MLTIETGNDLLVASGPDRHPGRERTFGANLEAQEDSLDAYFQSLPGVIRLLRTTFDPEKRHELVCLLYGGLLSRPRRELAEKVLPVVYEYIRAAQGRGAEALFLSLLSAAQTYAPELFSHYVSVASALPIKNTVDTDVFCDFSIPRRALIAIIDPHEAQRLLERVSMFPPSMIDIGMVARGGPATPPSPELEQSVTRKLSEDYDGCVARFITAGWSIASAAELVSSAPLDPPAVETSGELAITDAAKEAWGTLCVGYRLRIDPRGRGEGRGSGVGVLGGFCKTISPNALRVSAVSPKAYPPPTLARLLPLTNVLATSAADPQWHGREGQDLFHPPLVEEEAIPDSIRRYIPPIAIERLGENHYLVHNLP